MQMAKPIIALASLTLLTTPVLAKNAKAPKADAEETTPTCSSAQLGADGNWVTLPCQELGPHSSSSQHRAPPKPHDEAPH